MAPAAHAGRDRRQAQATINDEMKSAEIQAALQADWGRCELGTAGISRRSSRTNGAGGPPSPRPPISASIDDASSTVFDLDEVVATSAVGSLAPLLRGEVRGEGGFSASVLSLIDLYPLTRIAARSDLSPQAGRGDRCAGTAGST